VARAPEEIPPNPPLERGGEEEAPPVARVPEEIPPNPPFERGGEEEAPPVARAPEQQLTGVAARVDAIAERITVRIEGGQGHGSGVVVAKQGNTYYVATAAHVVSGSGSYQVVAPDGARYPVTEVKTQEAMDLAVVQFASPVSYSVANLADYRLPTEEKRWVFVSGWPIDRGNRRLLTGGLVFSKERGAIAERYDESLAQSQANPENQGYELVYTNITYKGMSGGPVLDSQGRVIGFHAAADGDALEEVYLGYSFGVPTSTFVGLAKRLGMQQKWLQVETTVAPVLSQQEDAEVRQNLFATTVPSGNSDARDWVNYGNQLWRIFEYDAAVQAFDQAVQRKPDFYQAWYARGLALKDLGKYPEAIASFEQAIKHRADFYPAWQQKGTNAVIFKEVFRGFDRCRPGYCD
jgi:S1-C subfamily serine protease